MCPVWLNTGIVSQNGDLGGSWSNLLLGILELLNIMSQAFLKFFIQHRHHSVLQAACKWLARRPLTTGMAGTVSGIAMDPTEV